MGIRAITARLTLRKTEKRRGVNGVITETGTMGRAKVNAIKMEYDKAPTRGKAKSVDFDTLYELFESDCNTFTVIGEIVGLSRERIRQLYLQYFQPLFPRRPTGRVRRKVCTRKRRANRKENWVLEGKVLEAAILANDNGLSVEPVWVNEHGHSVNWMRESVKQLRINGYLCSVHADAKPWLIVKTGKTPFYRLNRKFDHTGDDIDFHIMLLPEYRGPLYEQEGSARNWVNRGTVVVPPSVLVIPKAAVSEVKVYYVSAVPPALRSHFVMPEADLWEYRDRWDLLK